MSTINNKTEKMIDNSCVNLNSYGVNELLQYILHWKN